jgi:hypothetical protein
LRYIPFQTEFQKNDTRLAGSVSNRIGSEEAAGLTAGRLALPLACQSVIDDYVFSLLLFWGGRKAAPVV